MAGQLRVGSSGNGSTPQGNVLPNVDRLAPRSPLSARGEGWVRWLPPVVFRFIKFCLVGGSGVFVDMGVLFLLADPRSLGLNITFSKICAAEIALINNFIWNELWTFRRSSADTLSAGGEGKGEVVHRSTFDPRRSPFDILIARRFLLFNAICGIGICLAVLSLHLFHRWLGWNLYFSNFLAIIVVTFWNYALNARFNWHLERK